MKNLERSFRCSRKSALCFEKMFSKLAWILLRGALYLNGVLYMRSFLLVTVFQSWMLLMFCWNFWSFEKSSFKKTHASLTWRYLTNFVKRTTPVVSIVNDCLRALILKLLHGLFKVFNNLVKAINKLSPNKFSKGESKKRNRKKKRSGGTGCVLLWRLIRNISVMDDKWTVS